MSDMARDPAVLEELRMQRSRLAERMRPPWWYLTGAGVLFVLAFASPFSSRYLPQGVPTWPVLVVALLMAGFLHWALTRTTGISVGIPDLTYRPGRPARLVMLAVSVVALLSERFLIDRGLPVAAGIIAALAVVAGVVSVQAALRGIRQHLRDGTGVA